MLEIGDKAPDFTLPDQDGEDVTLSQFRGQTVVLYFYPKADTPGCTAQACGVRDHLPDYERAGAVVLGASPDPVAKVKRFHDKQGLNFRLLADEDHSVADTYGVWAEKSMSPVWNEMLSITSMPWALSTAGKTWVPSALVKASLNHFSPSWPGA